MRILKCEKCGKMWAHLYIPENPKDGSAKICYSCWCESHEGKNPFETGGRCVYDEGCWYGDGHDYFYERSYNPMQYKPKEPSPEKCMRIRVKKTARKVSEEIWNNGIKTLSTEKTIGGD
uniref:Uncharacterized protein n=1 Tax=viral metagenome TaxID=1070528 RepID=A0A6M3JCD4_9ZZZZ